jgi:hypothetical protein
MISRELKSQSPGNETVTFKYQSVFNDEDEEIFRAGQLVPAGTYVEIDGWRQVTLDMPGTLPASLDGRRVEYRRYYCPWLQETA